MSTLSPLDALLASDRPIILDGGLATSLEATGLNLNNPLWSASVLLHESLPNSVVNVHKAFFAAGADLAITNTYQASVPGLQKYSGLSEADARSVIGNAVKCACVARDKTLRSKEDPSRHLFIAGGVGPYGAFLSGGEEYTGRYEIKGNAPTLQDLKEFHRGRCEELVRAEVDLLAFETIPSFLEVRALLELLKEEFPSSVAWFSFTISTDGKCMGDGTPLEEVFKLLSHEDQVIAVGFNCNTPKQIDSAIAYVQPFFVKPLIVYPNSGEEWDSAAKRWRGGEKKREKLSDWATKWCEQGVKFIGGCCRTSAEDIRGLRLKTDQKRVATTPSEAHKSSETNSSNTGDSGLEP